MNAAVAAQLGGNYNSTQIFLRRVYAGLLVSFLHFDICAPNVRSCHWEIESTRFHMLRDSCIDAVRQEPQSVTSVSPLLRQTYRLAVVCHTSDANAIQAELKIMFERNGFARFSLQCEQTCPMFVRLTAMLESTIAERTALVRIVNHLGTMESVRRLQWATVPNR